MERAAIIRERGVSFLVIFIAVALALGASRATPAGCNEWTTNGPWGGEAQVLAVDPLLEGALYAAAGWGIYKSADGGATWAEIGLDLSLYTVQGRIVSMTVDPLISSTLYAITAWGKLLKSTDGGTSWATITDGIPDRVRNICIDTADSATLYIAAREGLFKSTDGGATWAPLGFPEAFEVILDPQAPQTLYAEFKQGDYDYGLSKSKDGGATWTEIGGGFPPYGAYFLSLAIGRGHPAPLYAATWDAAGGGVSRSTDGGATWQEADNGIPTHPDWLIERVVAHPVIVGTAYAVRNATWDNGGGKIYKSTDAGTSWSAAGDPTGCNDSIGSLAVSPLSPETVYCGTLYGLFKSADGGASWARADEGLFPAGAVAPAFDPATPGALYWNGLKSADWGATWVPMGGEGLPCGFRPTPIIDPLNPTTFYISGFGIFKSTDAGETWFPSDNGILWMTSDLIVDPLDSNNLYVSTDGGVYKSTDAGAWWEPASDGLPAGGIETLALDPLTPSTLYLGLRTLDLYTGGVYKSTDGAATWARTINGIPEDYPWVTTIAVDPRTPATLFAGLGLPYPGLYKSTDGAATWEIVRGGLPDRISITALALDPRNPERVYIYGEYLCGVDEFCSKAFKSGDGGVSWRAMNGGPRLPGHYGYFNGIAVDPWDPSHLFAGSNAGLYSITLAPLPGDCNGDETVTIGEIQKAINMFLGTQPPGCTVDGDGDGTVSIGEVQGVINGFLGLEDWCG